MEMLMEGDFVVDDVIRDGDLLCLLTNDAGVSSRAGYHLALCVCGFGCFSFGCFRFCFGFGFGFWLGFDSGFRIGISLQRLET